MISHDPPIDADVPETRNRDGAFPRLADSQLERFRAVGEVRDVEPGEILFRAGDSDSDFFVVEPGAVAIVQGLGEENRVMAIHGEHRFLGELSVLTGRDVHGDHLAEFNGSRPLLLETSRPGVFAVGDVHSGSIKRVASAVGKGSMAVRLVHERLADPATAVSPQT